MKIKNICFSVLLLCSVLVVGFCFRIAVLQRGDAPLGGELFTIALPLYIVWKKISEMGRKIQRLKRYNQSLKSML